jgi:hypothetical protein
MDSRSTVPLGRLITRDPRIWVSAVTMIVAWGIALLNMAGFTVTRRNSSLEASDWKVSVAIAAFASVLLVPMMIARILLWKRVVPVAAVVESATPKGVGLYFKYRYEHDGSPHNGKFSVAGNSPWYGTRPGDQITVYVDPRKPHKSVVAL